MCITIITTILYIFNIKLNYDFNVHNKLIEKLFILIAIFYSYIETPHILFEIVMNYDYNNNDGY